MNTLTPDQVLNVPAGELAAYPSEALFRLKNDAADLLGIAKGIVAHIDRALDLKYAEHAQQIRLANGKDTGVVHFDDESVRVTADLPKKVEWDQAQLSHIAEQIAAAGDNPAEFIEATFRVSETKYNAWPASIRKAFLPARTLKTGKPAFRLALIKE